MVCIVISRKSTHPITQTYAQALTLELEQKTYSRDYYDNLEKEEFIIRSQYGYQLKGFFLPNNERSNRVIVISHGYECTLFRSIKYVSMFHQLGYSVVVYDHRNHGISGGTFTSFGFYEKEDMKSILDYVENHIFEEPVFFGSQGSSMGAAIALQHAEIDSRIRFVISESSFETLHAQMKIQIKRQMKYLSTLFLFGSSAMNKIMYGYFYGQVSPIKAIKNLDIPILIIHGDSDSFIPLSHAKNLFEQKPKAKKLLIVKQADHGLCFNNNPEIYYSNVKDLLQGINTD